MIRTWLLFFFVSSAWANPSMEWLNYQQLMSLKPQQRALYLSEYVGMMMQLEELQEQRTLMGMAPSHQWAKGVAALLAVMPEANAQPLEITVRPLDRRAAYRQAREESQKYSATAVTRSIGQKSPAPNRKDAYISQQKKNAGSVRLASDTSTPRQHSDESPHFSPELTQTAERPKPAGQPTCPDPDSQEFKAAQTQARNNMAKMKNSNCVFGGHFSTYKNNVVRPGNCQKVTEFKGWKCKNPNEGLCNPYLFCVVPDESQTPPILCVPIRDAKTGATNLTVRCSEAWREQLPERKLKSCAPGGGPVRGFQEEWNVARAEFKKKYNELCLGEDPNFRILFCEECSIMNQALGAANAIAQAQAQSQPQAQPPATDDAPSTVNESPSP